MNKLSTDLRFVENSNTALSLTDLKDTGYLTIEDTIYSTSTPNDEGQSVFTIDLELKKQSGYSGDIYLDFQSLKDAENFAIDILRKIGESNKTGHDKAAFINSILKSLSS
jgi:hypothetical protein